MHATMIQIDKHDKITYGIMWTYHLISFKTNTKPHFGKLVIANFEVQAKDVTRINSRMIMTHVVLCVFFH